MEKYLKKLHNTQQKILDYVAEICEKNRLSYFLIGGTLLGAVRHKGYIPWDDDIDIVMPRDDYNKFIEICKTKLDDKYLFDDKCVNKKYWAFFSKIRLKNTLYEEKCLKNYDGPKEIWIDIFPLDSCNGYHKKLERHKIILKCIRSILYVRNAKDESYNKRSYIKFIKPLLRIFPRKFLLYIEKQIIKKHNAGDYFINFGSQYSIKKQLHLKEKYFPAKELTFEGKKYKVPNDYEYVLTKIFGKNYMELPPKEKRITHNPLRIVFEDGEEINFEKI